MSDTSPSPEKSLKQSILQRIEAEQVRPRPRLFFVGRECLVWFLWVFSIIIGSFAIAVMAYVWTHHQYALYEATHEDFYTFLVEFLPYLWIVAFGLMTFVAVYNVHLTKRGYRYPVSVIMASSLVLSLVGGATLQFFGFGYTVDYLMGRYMYGYQSQDQIETKLWQSPQAGRMVGKQVLSTLAPTTTVVFEDINGARWSLDVTELSKQELALLASEIPVRIIGINADNEGRRFAACGAFPWLAQRNPTVAELSEARHAFIERVSRHIRRGEEPGARRMAVAEKTAQGKLPDNGACEKLEVMRRVRPTTQNFQSTENIIATSTTP